MTVDPRLLELLVCLSDQGDLREERDGAAEVLVCSRCGLHYPVREGIPIMLAEEAYRP